jgi:hypothetical protein
MEKIMVSLLAFTVSLMMAHGQDPGRPSLSLEVKPIATGGAVRSSNSADIGRSYDSATNKSVSSQAYASSRNRDSQIGLEIAVRNFRSTPQAVQVETRYFAKPVTGGTFSLLNSTSQPVQIGAADTIRVTSQSAAAKSVSQRSFSEATSQDPYSPKQTVTSSRNTASGSKLFGWIVRVLVDGNCIQMRASNPTLEQFAKTEQTQTPLPTAGPVR